MFRVFNPWDRDDPGWQVAHELKTFTAAGYDHATELVHQGLWERRIRGTLLTRLVDGNTPGPLQHYPRSVQVYGDEVPRAPVVAREIRVSGKYLDPRWNQIHFNQAVTEADYIDLILTATSYDKAKRGDWMPGRVMPLGGAKQPA